MPVFNIEWKDSKGRPLPPRRKGPSAISTFFTNLTNTLFGPPTQRFSRYSIYSIGRRKHTSKPSHAPPPYKAPPAHRPRTQPRRHESASSRRPGPDHRRPEHRRPEHRAPGGGDPRVRRHDTTLRRNESVNKRLPPLPKERSGTMNSTNSSRRVDPQRQGSTSSARRRHHADGTLKRSESARRAAPEPRRQDSHRSERRRV
ncbi:hypothetical protein BOTBODRAFT_39622 [Botryobasidium botryosum FD-172 SS1]|uniref:Uncharacterized protein n=1 Tax=Botryobasidium botryosum (strain FD-172 SS1) TaxID=930990 RepID=A0A067M3I2_BOTB1|nr:hypothetical protein BOTBODRAFT_39622 [Botryobasidium botryosum FD-172 SS1]